MPIEVPGKGGTRVVENDEHPRPGTTAESLAKLRSAFRRDGGTVTAGNASGVNDGAAAIVVMSARRARERGLRAFGTVESYASVGVEPKIMGIGPVPAVRKALTRAGLELGDIDLFELNEAFAAQSLAVLRELDIDGEQDQPPRRRDRARTSDRRQRRPDPRHAAARDAAPQRRARPRHALRGRRPGTGGGHPQRGGALASSDGTATFRRAAGGACSSGWAARRGRPQGRDGHLAKVQALGRKKRGGTRPGWDGGLYAFMRRVLATEHGGALYAKRQVMVEPVCADTKFNRRIDRFLRRGRAAARSEWRLTNAAHNLRG